MIIYVAGPYTAPSISEVETNVQTAIEAGAEILERGHYPLIPHLNHWFDIQTNSAYDYETYIVWGLKLLFVCDALYMLAPSPGANREYAFAKEHGKFIYFNLKDIPNV